MAFETEYGYFSSTPSSDIFDIYPICWEKRKAFPSVFMYILVKSPCVDNRKT
jgi:hypothetical protein